ncbi:GntR family transcriptional regulator [Microterricola viridarii]|uniref:GntR family transcriptional regulator n=1 Tax=Microterricola viridarii TaxID=412690 RepID=A0A120I0Y8_9MICO|nr:GntR family transcriptional regulator [Microterricola viridarii]AMB58429.1 GntR family transcriptional regulator [Microterricola viridarii]
MLIRIDPTLSTPLFEQLAASIRASVIDGRLTVGERLLPARELAAALDINVHTVLRAYQILREEGLLDMRPGRGAVVAGRMGQHAALAGAIHDLVDEAKLRNVSESALLSLIKEAYK